MSGTSGGRGYIYETRLCMLLFTRSFMLKLTEFKLDYQVKEAGKFDDIVFYDGSYYHLIQLKHKETNDHRSILHETLFTDKFNKDYNLIKYVHTVSSIKNDVKFNGKIKNAVVFTNNTFNKDFDAKTSTLKLKKHPKNWYEDNQSIPIKVLDLCHLEALNLKILDCSKGTFFKFYGDEVVQILNQQSLYMKKDVDDMTVDQIRDALDEIVYAVGQPNDEELSILIKNEIKEYYKLQDVDHIYNNLEVTMRKWCDTKKNGIFKEVIDFEDAETFYQKDFKEIMFEVQSPIKSFIGREKEIEKIREYLFLNKYVLINGLGGIGKTNLARKFIENYGKLDFYNRVIWICAENDQSVQDSFNRLAEKLNLQKIREKQTKTIITEIFDYFYGVKVLFVFDNFDNVEDKKKGGFVNYCIKYARQPNKQYHPYFLFTSRNKNCFEDVYSIELDVLSEHEARTLLTAKLGEITEDQFRKLSNYLHYFPLALQQAIAYIIQRRKRPLYAHYQIDDYLKEFEKQNEPNILWYKVSDSFGIYEEATFATWNVTFEAIENDEENKGMEAIKILQFMSYLYADEISPEMFVQYLSNKAITSDALFLLESYSLITKSEEKYKIHRLVQSVVRLKFKFKEEQLLEEVFHVVIPEVFKTCKNCLKQIAYNAAIERCSNEQILHMDTIAFHLKDHERLQKKYGKLCDDTGRTNYVKLLLNDDIEKIKCIQKPRERVQMIVESVIEDLIQNKCIKVFKFLVENNFIEKNGQFNYSRTPMHFAIISNDFDLVKYLKEIGVDLTIKDMGGDTPLHIAALENRFEIVEYLLNAGAPINIGSNMGWTPLLIAVERNNLSMVKILVEFGADCNYLNCFGWTPLHSASHSNFLEISKYLVSQKADLNLKNNGGDTPLHVAVLNNDIRTVEFLISSGAEINIGSNDGWAPLHIAVEKNNLEIITRLLTAGADVNFRNKYDWTALYFACHYGFLEVVTTLVNSNAQLNTHDTSWETPLHIAVKENRLEVVKYLIKKGAEVNIGNLNGYTPLHFAVERNYIEIIKCLFAARADKNYKNKDGFSSSSFAHLANNVDVIRLFESESNLSIL